MEPRAENRLSAAGRLHRTARKGPWDRPTVRGRYRQSLPACSWASLRRWELRPCRSARANSSLAAVNDAVISEPRVSSFANVVVWVLFSGSRITFPHPPVTGSTRLGTFPAAILSPSGLPGDRVAIDESRIRERRRHGGEFVDDHAGRGIASQHRQQRDAGIVAAGFADFRQRHRSRRDRECRPCWRLWRELQNGHRRWS